MIYDVHIDRLVLHGVAEPEAAEVAAAFADRLGALLTATAPGWHPADAGVVRAGTFTPAATTARTGARLAVAVHQGLTR